MLLGLQAGELLVADEALSFNPDDVILCCLTSAIVQLKGR
jgi:hypothetical protein